MMASGTFLILPGLPPKGDSRRHIGFNATHEPFILSWDQKNGCWVGVGMSDDPLYGRMPLAIAAVGDKATFFTHHCAIPGA